MPRIVLLLSTLAAALVLASGAGLLNAAKPAAATFPGTNGKIAYSAYDGNDYEIYTINPDGTGKFQVTNNDDTNALSPDYSPDGKKIVYIKQDPYGPGREIYIVNSDGSGEVRVTYNDIEEQGPTFSPDGTKIAFFSDAESSNESEIFTINTNGTGLFQVTNNDVEDDSWPEYSPNGDKIAYQRGQRYLGYKDDEIFTINPDGTGRVQVTNNTTIDNSPEYSPSGNRIVYYAAGKLNDSEIYTIRPDGTGKVQLTNNTQEDCFPTYSPDGKRIAYESSNQNSRNKLLKIPVGGGTPTLVESHHKDPLCPSQPSWGSQ